MQRMIESVDQRTKMAGENRLELLIFNLGTDQDFGINVFKVKEVLQMPKLADLPGAENDIIGIASIREDTVSVIDLAESVKLAPRQDYKPEYLIVTEYNRTLQGFAVGNVDRIVNMAWTDIKSPPKSTGKAHYLTAIAKFDNRLIGILDVERILDQVNHCRAEVTELMVPSSNFGGEKPKHVLIVDDSSVARNQLKRCLDSIGITCTAYENGKEALDHLKKLQETVDDIASVYSMVISDIEMPQLDGYTLTAEIRNSDALKHLPIILHTSLSGEFNQALVQRIGADHFIAKFEADTLAKAVLDIYEPSAKILGECIA